MDRKLIQKSIDYIEDHLKTDISAAELSDMAGFSLFHYYRLFSCAVGMPVMQYVLRRRLLNAIYEISCGNKMIDAALNYGFETYAGFYRAFQREFGYTPSQYLDKFKVKKPYRINLFKEEHIMLTHKKIREILKYWGKETEKITDVVYTESGEISATSSYVGNEYVLKYSANLGKVETNISIAKALENIGLSAAIPIKTLDGKDYVADGELFFYLTQRINGSPLKANTMYIDDYISKARFVGEIIGQLSLALCRIDILADDKNLYENVMNWAIPKLKGTLNVDKEFFNDYAQTFGGLYEGLPKKIIHRDPNPSNIILSDGKWGFIDFELSERNIRIFDPCYAAAAILSESFSERNDEKLSKWIEVYKNIIYGYDDVVKLSTEEKRAVPYVIMSNQLIATAYFSEQEKYKELFEINKKMTEWLTNNFQKLNID